MRTNFFYPFSFPVLMLSLFFFALTTGIAGGENIVRLAGNQEVAPPPSSRKAGVTLNHVSSNENQARDQKQPPSEGLHVNVISGSFAIRAVAPTDKLTKVSGMGQQEKLVGESPVYQSFKGSAKFAPLTVRVTDEAGKGLPGIPISWTKSGPPQMAIQFEPGGHVQCITVTDGEGNSTLNKMGGSSMSVYNALGKFKAIATMGDDATRAVTFDLEVIK